MFEFAWCVLALSKFGVFLSHDTSERDPHIVCATIALADFSNTNTLLITTRRAVWCAAHTRYLQCSPLSPAAAAASKNSKPPSLLALIILLPPVLLLR